MKMLGSVVTYSLFGVGVVVVTSSLEKVASILHRPSSATCKICAQRSVLKLSRHTSRSLHRRQWLDQEGFHLDGSYFAVPCMSGKAFCLLSAAPASAYKSASELTLRLFQTLLPKSSLSVFINSPVRLFTQFLHPVPQRSLFLNSMVLGARDACTLISWLLTKRLSCNKTPMASNDDCLRNTSAEMGGGNHTSGSCSSSITLLVFPLQEKTGWCLHPEHNLLFRSPVSRLMMAPCRYRCITASLPPSYLISEKVGGAFLT